jgi:hypothetical protein
MSEINLAILCVGIVIGLLIGIRWVGPMFNTGRSEGRIEPTPETELNLVLAVLKALADRKELTPSPDQSELTPPPKSRKKK